MRRKYIPHLNISIYEVTKPEEAPWVREGAHYDATTACCMPNGDIYGRHCASLTDIAHELGHRKCNWRYDGYAKTGIKHEIEAESWALKHYGDKTWFDRLNVEERLMQLRTLFDLVPDGMIVFDFNSWFTCCWKDVKQYETPEEIRYIMREKVASWSLAPTATDS